MSASQHPEIHTVFFMLMA